MNSSGSFFQLREGSLLTPSGEALYTESMVLRGEASRLGTILLVHGLGEHLGRYRHVCEYLCRKGYHVFAYDQRGHGRSTGRRGHVDRFDDYVEDLSRVILHLEEAAEPLFLLAHSMGALVGLQYLAKKSKSQALIAGVFMGTPLKPNVEPSDLKQWFALLLDRAGLSLSFANEIDPRFLSRNEAVGEAYRRDPLVVRQVTTSWYASFLETISNLAQDLGETNIPALFLHGSEDRIAHPDGSRVIFQTYPAEKKQLHIFEGCYHELLNEDCYPGILDQIHQWFEMALAQRELEHPPGRVVQGSPSWK